MSYHDIRRNMGIFIKSFLSGLIFRLRCASSTSLPQFVGVSQGSVLSTTLFLFAVNGLVPALSPGIRLSLHVDDLAIFASSPSILDLHQIFQSAITPISSLAANHDFPVSTSKTFSIFFFRSRIGSQPPLYNAPIQFRHSGKVLGVIFDSWRDHILSVEERACSHLLLLQTLTYILGFGLQNIPPSPYYPNPLLPSLWLSYIFSLLTYLDTIHHCGLRLAQGAVSPVESL